MTAADDGCFKRKLQLVLPLPGRLGLRQQEQISNTTTAPTKVHQQPFAGLWGEPSLTVSLLHTHHRAAANSRRCRRYASQPLAERLCVGHRCPGSRLRSHLSALGELHRTQQCVQRSHTSQIHHCLRLNNNTA